MKDAASETDPRPAPSVLATDLDGTLIPLGPSERNRSDLEILRREFEEGDSTLVFVTGRHLASVRAVAREMNLPRPAWIVCDVGTSIYRLNGEEIEPVSAYADRLGEIVGDVDLASLRPDLERIEGLRVQEEEKLGPYKLSFYSDRQRVDELTARIVRRLEEIDAPYSVVSSVDPFEHVGLIDVLPRGADKAFALAWWRESQGLPETAVVYAGDSGNDWAALVAGYRAVVVANADRALAQRIADRHAENGWTGRLHLARETATSGVLEGWRAFTQASPS